MEGAAISQAEEEIKSHARLEQIGDTEVVKGGSLKRHNQTFQSCQKGAREEGGRSGNFIKHEREKNPWNAGVQQEGKKMR